ncbi:MAG: hypothetical protein DRJ10_19985 [Bacteroidetes bacterium]|nr:MAG: hypothetical protein DRJ10_19985 [Bacteroidota bacterium]
MQYSKHFISFINNRLLQHILFWGFFIFLETLHIYDNTTELNLFSVLLLVISKFSAAVVLIYLNLLIFIPYLLEKNKTLFYIITIASSYFIVVYSVYGLHLLFSLERFTFIEDHIERPRLLAVLFGLTFLLTILSSLIHFAKRWVKLKDVELDFKEEQRQRLEAELKTLKAQINPHFLFNSLNNIYSLSLDKSDLAPEMILKLSDLMSYIIYDAREEFVPLKKELEFIENHIDLERIRVSNRVDTNYESDESLWKYNIAPLLLTPFIENAFKYVSARKDEKAFINIKLSENQDELHFFIENSAEEELATFEHNNHGIGIENVKKRLKLIYPDKHKLDIEHNDKKFTINLKIKI